MGHNILTSIVDRHKNTTVYRTSMATEHVGVKFSQYNIATVTALTGLPRPALL